MKTLTKIKFVTLSLAIVLTGGSGIVSADEYRGTLSSDGSGSGGAVVVSPTASPATGTYTTEVSVTLTALNSDQIRYFLNTTNLNNELTCNTGTVYNGPFIINTIGENLVRAIACYGTHASPLSSFTYTVVEAEIEEEVVSTPTGNTGGGGGRSRSGGGDGVATAPSTASYDFNSDGNIDVFDFNILIVNWGSKTATDKTTGDANGDGKVDIFDFNLLIINWQS